eukprot:m.80426 g.80426  ORF g.80426 m.80426 type:complete len:57 (-) comp12599_c0_seq1:54-224(-)
MVPRVSFGDFVLFVHEISYCELCFIFCVCFTQIHFTYTTHKEKSNMSPVFIPLTVF